MMFDPDESLWFDPFRKQPKKQAEPDLTLLFEPKRDVTAYEFVMITKVVGCNPGPVKIKPSALNAWAEGLDSAYRHFRIDDSDQKASEMEKAHKDLIGKPISGSILVELAKRFLGGSVKA